jgi:hypothetical protein
MKPIEDRGDGRQEFGAFAEIHFRTATDINFFAIYFRNPFQFFFIDILVRSLWFLTEARRHRGEITIVHELNGPIHHHCSDLVLLHLRVSAAL